MLLKAILLLTFEMTDFAFLTKKIILEVRTDVDVLRE
jgi:hypothetical protein